MLFRMRYNDTEWDLNTHSVKFPNTLFHIPPNDTPAPNPISVKFVLNGLLYIYQCCRGRGAKIIVRQPKLY